MAELVQGGSLEADANRLAEAVYFRDWAAEAVGSQVDGTVHCVGEV